MPKKHGGGSQLTAGQMRAAQRREAREAARLRTAAKRVAESRAVAKGSAAPTKGGGRLSPHVKQAGVVDPGGLLHAVGNAASVVAKDVKGLGRGIVTSGIEGGAAAGKVVLSPDPRAKLEGLKDIARMAGQTAQAPFYFIPTAPMHGPPIHIPGLPVTTPGEAAHNWAVHPVTGALTVAGTVAPVRGAFGIKTLTRSIMDANPSLTLVDAVKLARIESRNPGALASPKYNIKGGLPERIINSTVQGKSGSKTRPVAIPQARSQLGRDYQRAADALSRKIPEGKVFSERQRANRALERAVTHKQRAAQAAIDREMAPVRKLGYNWRGKLSKPEAAAMVYALQSPPGAHVMAGPHAVLQTLEQNLKTGGYSIPGPGGHSWHNLSDYERESLQAQIDGLHEVLTNPPDLEALNTAVDSLESMAQRTEQLGLYIALGRARGKPPAVAQAIREGFQARKDALAKTTGQQGHARGFFPHRPEATDLGPTEFPGETRRPVAGDVLGTPKPPSLGQPNRLILFKGGRLNVDPRVLLSQFHQRLKMLWTEETRRDLYDEALPLSEIPEGQVGRGYLIRNPDETPASLTPEQRAMSHPENAARIANEALDWESRFDENLVGGIKEWAEQAFRDGRQGVDKLPEEWAADRENIRWLPKDVVHTRIKHVFSSKPDGIFAANFSTLNALTRIATITGKPLRYTLSNTVQDIIMGTLTNPAGMLKGVGNQASLARALPVVNSIWEALHLPDTLKRRNPELYDMVTVETGDVQATAGLPEFYARAQNKSQAVEHAVTTFQHKLGGALGELADNPYRVGIYLQRAKKSGFDTDERLSALLTEDRYARQRGEIRQQVRDDMLDFNRLSPSQRENISRFLFIWPFIRASARWPVTYARDYPVRAGVAAASTVGQEDDGTLRSGRDLFKFATPGGGEYDTGYAVPYGPAVEKMTDVARLAQGDLSVLGEQTPPFIKQAGQQVFSGRVGEAFSGSTIDAAARSLIPGYSGLTDTLGRGVTGIPVVDRFTPKTGEGRLSRATKNRKEEDKATLRKAWDAGSQSGAELPDPAEAKRSFDAWWLYQEFASRAKYGALEQGDTKVPDKNKALLLNKVARELYPSIPISDDSVIRANADKDPVKAKQYVDWLSKQMFSARAQVLAADNKASP